MSERESLKSPAENLVRLFALCGGILGIFALYLFVLQPLLTAGIGPRAAQLIYIVIRVGGLMVLAYTLAKDAKRNRLQVLSTVLLVGFIDQVLLKGLWIKRDMAVHPADWIGFEPTNAAIFVNMAIGYMFFIPIVAIFAFLGMESTRFRRDWQT